MKKSSVLYFALFALLCLWLPASALAGSSIQDIIKKAGPPKSMQQQKAEKEASRSSAQAQPQSPSEMFEKITFNSTIEDIIEYALKYGEDVYSTVIPEKYSQARNMKRHDITRSEILSDTSVAQPLLNRFGIALGTQEMQYRTALRNYPALLAHKKGAFVVDEVKWRQAKGSRHFISVLFLTMPGISKKLFVLNIHSGFFGEFVKSIPDALDARYGKHEFLDRSEPIRLWESGNIVAYTIHNRGSSNPDFYMYDKELYKKFVDYITAELN